MLYHKILYHVVQDCYPIFTIGLLKGVLIYKKLHAVTSDCFRFVPCTHRERPYDPLLHTTSQYGR